MRLSADSCCSALLGLGSWHSDVLAALLRPKNVHRSLWYVMPAAAVGHSKLWQA